jgi:hypothetical protein
VVVVGVVLAIGEEEEVVNATSEWAMIGKQE